MSRLPIRIRLTLGFALAMAIVLAATGAFVYLRLGSTLDETISERLDTRLAEVAALAARGAPVASVTTDESFTRVLEPGEARPREGVGSVPGVDGRVRIVSRSVDSPGGSKVVVVGESLEERDNALSGLLVQLLIVGPAALVLASLLGYWIAGAALRPVEAMRVEAAEISGAQPGRRLPRSPARDEIARLGDTLNAMLDRLDGALERERSFVSDASHELRTPLALVKTELELALRRPRSASELEDALRSALASTERLVRLAEDLLVLARSDQGKLPLRPAPVRASDVLQAVAERFTAQAQAAGGGVEVDAPEELMLEADRIRLEQALGNLVANALQHGKGSIGLSAAERDGRVELHVTDDGPGFPVGFLPHAFERFARADEARSGGGAGLGLAIADAVARAHGGSAHAANRPDGGADVWLSIPNGRV